MTNTITEPCVVQDIQSHETLEERDSSIEFLWMGVLVGIIPIDEQLAMIPQMLGRCTRC